MYRVVFYPWNKTYILILHQGCPVEYAFYSLLLSYMGSCVLVSESLKSCLSVLCLRLYYLALLSCLLFPVSQATFFFL